jgi:hypothetical protein
MRLMIAHVGWRRRRNRRRGCPSAAVVALVVVAVALWRASTTPFGECHDAPFLSQ